MAVDVRRRSNVTEEGRGRQPMLFAHGFGCDQRMWRFVAPAFEDTHRLVLFDHIGCGGSDLSAYDDERHGSLDGYAEDVLDIVEALDLRDVVYVGHSVSAMIGLLAAVRQPQRFDRLVMVCPSPRYLNDPPHYVGGFERADLEEMLDLMERNHFGWANFLAPLVMDSHNPEALTRELEASLCSLDPYVSRRFARVTFFGDHRDDLHRLEVPSLIIQCLHDGIAPRDVGRFMHERMPRSTLVELDASGHCPHMSHPDATIAAIREYLAHA